MAEYKFVVMSKPVPGREDEYNDWYENQHLGDVLRLPGVVAAQRFELEQVLSDQAPEQRYLAIYDIVSDDLGKTLEPFFSLGNTDQMPISDAMDSSVNAFIYRARTPLMRESEAKKVVTAA